MLHILLLWLRQATVSTPWIHAAHFVTVVETGNSFNTMDTCCTFFYCGCRSALTASQKLPRGRCDELLNKDDFNSVNSVLSDSTETSYLIKSPSSFFCTDDRSFLPNTIGVSLSLGYKQVFYNFITLRHHQSEGHEISDSTSLSDCEHNPSPDHLSVDQSPHQISMPL